MTAVPYFGMNFQNLSKSVWSLYPAVLVQAGWHLVPALNTILSRPTAPVAGWWKVRRVTWAAVAVRGSDTRAWRHRGEESAPAPTALSASCTAPTVSLCDPDQPENIISYKKELFASSPPIVEL